VGRAGQHSSFSTGESADMQYSVFPFLIPININYRMQTDNHCLLHCHLPAWYAEMLPVVSIMAFHLVKLVKPFSRERSKET